jgi:stage III sporulation protein AB
VKWIGALLIMLGCGGVGFLTVAYYKREERALHEFIVALQHMNCELQYTGASLPLLCRSAAQRCGGSVGQVLERLGEELEAQISPNASACMHAAVRKQKYLPEKAERCLLQFGDSLGCFDLPGQIKSMEAVEKFAKLELDELRENKEARCRTYQTLGLCVGFALVVLFI